MYVLDCYTPIGQSFGGLPAQDMIMQNNYVLGAAREFFAAQTLFLHGSIAYCMYAYMVRKVRGSVSSVLPVLLGSFRRSASLLPTEVFFFLK